MRTRLPVEQRPPRDPPGHEQRAFGWLGMVPASSVGQAVTLKPSAAVRFADFRSEYMVVSDDSV